MKLLLTWKPLEEEMKIITNVLAVCKHVKLNHEYCLEVTTTAKPVPAAATQTWRSLVLSVVSDAVVLSFSCLCSPIMPLARSWEVSPLLLWQSVVQYNFRFSLPPSSWSLLFLFCFFQFAWCMSEPAWNFRHVRGGSISALSFEALEYIS